MNTVNGCSISPSANDFIQINKVVNEKMINQAIDWLSPQPDERVADWFSGLGNFTLPIAKRGAKVQAIEGVAEMVRRARDNAQQQGIENVEWLHLDLANKTNVEASLQQGVDKVLLDPSREGALTVCFLNVQFLTKLMRLSMNILFKFWNEALKMSNCVNTL
jgi:SAM-dependent methyltransferases related to tRNA (uracil-5-)-methyltransferase